MQLDREQLQVQHMAEMKRRKSQQRRHSFVGEQVKPVVLAPAGTQREEFGEADRPLP